MNLSQKVGKIFQEHNIIAVTAESCTAGLIASTIAETSGSSAWLDSGFVVYSAQAKNKLLGVNFSTINIYNITSCQVAEEMSVGALLNSHANFAIATTGVAGPNGGTQDIPVGTVCFAWSIKNNNDFIETISEKVLFNGSRNEIRQAAAEYSLEKSLSYIKDLAVKQMCYKL